MKATILYAGLFSALLVRGKDVDGPEDVGHFSQAQNHYVPLPFFAPSLSSLPLTGDITGSVGRQSLSIPKNQCTIQASLAVSGQGPEYGPPRREERSSEYGLRGKRRQRVERRVGSLPSSTRACKGISAEGKSTNDKKRPDEGPSTP
ncbi:hypothetical protein CISG_01287 [Coccidioides immitis RMSCC 3703]|uniref:Uncharacterized protein n=1 Tax=Coccidioides immitis RMSCC 3703 TaxID=454286 RepID=A0A0J8QUI6_COCIT|nr:hypothetical protein CISG_01287 [Coccidioides immitis RMSCC 3703]